MAAKKEMRDVPAERNWMTGEAQTPPPLVPSPEARAIAESVEKPQRYIVGLTKECPFDYITIPTNPRDGGAFCFPKVTQKTFQTGDGMLALSGPIEGGVIEIYKDEYEKITEYIKTRGINWNISNPDEKRPEIVLLKPAAGQRLNRREVALGNIEPLAKYAYIVPARTVTADDQEASNRPPTLLEMEQQAATPASK